MRKPLCLFCAFFLCVSFLPAQNSIYTDAYYPLIQQAEMAVVSEDYAVALQFYQNAFAAVNGGFVRDYHNAVLCAIRAEQPAVAFGFLEKMALKGMTWEYFSQAAFTQLHAEPAWKKFEAAYDKLHQQHLAGTDLQYRRELSEMADQDQLFRQMEGSYAVYGDTIRKIDSSNIYRVLRLFAAKGFPSEDRIGTDFPNTPVYSIILHHHAQQLSQGSGYAGWPDLAPELVAAAQAGEIDPPVAAFFLELQNDPAYRMGAFGVIALAVDGVEQPEYYLDLPGDRVATDRIRTAFGLEPLAEYILKCDYRLAHPDTPFRLNDGHPFNVFGVDEASAADLRKALFKL